ncbi:MAG: DNA topoisomerase [Myxococcota bacterium]|nr:DNA topoisomerase [Myxococcota bacterium]
MTKRLVIAEKPSVARDIAEALSKDGYQSHDGGDWFETDRYLISFAVGHLLELNEPEEYKDEWKSWSLKHLPIIPSDFRLSPRDSKAQSRLKLLKKLAGRKEVVGLVNACDAGREGEHIFRTIEEWLDCGLPAERLWLSSLTNQAIRDGFEALEPGEKFQWLADSARCRAESDWLIGMNATRALTVRLKSLGYKDAWTAGRVQTPTLGMLVERELEIYRHRPEPYWEITATFQLGELSYEGSWQHEKTPKSGEGNSDRKRNRIFDRQLLDAIVKRLDQAKDATAVDQSSEQRQRAPIPYDLTSLQKDANSRFGMTAKQALDSAQRLYLNKLLTYPRTDSRHLSKAKMLPELNQMLGQISDDSNYGLIIKQIQGDGAQNINRVFDDSKVTDHHAIIPVALPTEPLSGTDQKIYDMVVRQFLASLMGPATYSRVERITKVDGDLQFKTTGRVLKVAGWRFAMGDEVGKGQGLQALPKNPQNVTLTKHDVAEKETKAKPRMSEANILARMESCGKEISDEELSDAMRDKGLGTPATRADTIERLIRREYVRRQGKFLQPTPKAIRLVEMLHEVGARGLVSVELTGEMEQKLRSVANGDVSRIDYMKAQRELATSLAEQLRSFSFDDLYEDERNLGAVPGHPKVQVRATPWGYQADLGEDEAFFLWKDLRGHVLQPATIRQLLANEEATTGPIPLPSRHRGQEDHLVNIRLVRMEEADYAKLLAAKKKRLPSRWRLEIVGEREQIAAHAEATAGEDLISTLCNCSKFDDVEIVETDRRYVDRGHVGSTERPVAELPKEVCKRPISRSEAEAYFSDGRTELLSNFISKRNRAFNAILFLKGNGRHGFEFEKRSERKGRGKGSS